MEREGGGRKGEGEGGEGGVRRIWPYHHPGLNILGVRQHDKLKNKPKTKSTPNKGEEGEEWGENKQRDIVEVGRMHKGEGVAGDACVFVEGIGGEEGCERGIVSIVAQGVGACPLLQQRRSNGLLILTSAVGVWICVLVFVVFVFISPVSHDELKREGGGCGETRTSRWGDVWCVCVVFGGLCGCVD